tara:strand:+ start:103 stop:663 length:561 start_codon:yes stop_codon:yes gene_type:complete
MMNEQIEVQVLLDRICSNGWEVENDNKYPYLYTKADEHILVSQEAKGTYGTNGIDDMVGVLAQLLEQSLRANDSRESKRLTRLSRGMMRVLGISSSRRVQIWDNASPELIDSLNAHQEFFRRVELAYDEVISDEHIPLMKNHGGGMVNAGWQISLKLHNHAHRQAIRHLRNQKYNDAARDEYDSRL